MLANEGFLGRRGEGWVNHGDAVDVVLLVMAHKVDWVQSEVVETFPQLAEIPFESERRFSASLHQVGETQQAFVKGALESLLPLCRNMAVPGGRWGWISRCWRIRPMNWPAAVTG